MLRILVFVLCLFTGIAQAKFLDVKEFYLDNGLQVIVIPNHKAPVIMQMLWYKVGSVDEPLGKGGMAHLLEHLMFRGTNKVKDSEFNDIVKKYGGETNAYTTHDFTVYHEFIDVSKLEVTLALEADRMQNLNISDEAFETERKIVLQERKQRIANNPYARFNEVVNKTLWQDNPYARPVSGTEDEINSITKEDIINFYKQYYSPNNAVLVLAGDITFEQARQLSEKYFGKIKASKINVKDVIVSEIKNTSFEVKQFMEEIKNPRYVIKYIVPNTVKNPQMFYALMLFSNYLGETENSYLNENLVLTEKVISVQSYYDGLNRGNDTLTISAIPNNNVNQIDKIIRKALEEAFNKFDNEELEKQKKKVLSSLIYLKDNPQDAAYIVGNFAALGLDINEIINYDEKIAKISLGDVQKAFADMISNNTVITAVLLPNIEKEK